MKEFLNTLAYGEELTAPYEDSNDKVLNTITYTGHEKDYETNLTYMMARYYSQGYGRFLSPDPGYDYDQLDPMSWNLYSYVRGNPIRFLDLTGMSFTEFQKIIQDIIDELNPAYKNACWENIEYGFIVYKDGNKYLLGKPIPGDATSVPFDFPPNKEDYPSKTSVPTGAFHFHQNEDNAPFSPEDVNALVQADKVTNGEVRYIFSMDKNYIYGLEIDNSVGEDLSNVSKELEKEILKQSRIHKNKDIIFERAMRNVAKRHKALHLYKYDRRRKKFEEIK